LLTVLATSPRVAPGLLSWTGWELLRSADAIFAPPGHPLLPVLDQAGLGYQIADRPPADDAGRVLAWLAAPGAREPTPPGARILTGSADLPGAHLLDLVATMEQLRTNCPWDAQQTHLTLAPHLLEEPYEAIEALESGDMKAFAEELGDVLLQVVFHARIAADFGIDDVADTIVAKLIRRHPHVFGSVTVADADEVKRNWDAIKKQEKLTKLAESQQTGVLGTEPADPSALDGVPFGQPALALAAQLQQRAERGGVPESLVSLADEGGLGAQLFRLVADARAAGLDPERELRAAARRYQASVQAWERD